MVSPNADPPVCKIIDFGRHKYLESKLGKDKKKPQQEVKGIKISPRIADHDLQTYVNRARNFLNEGDKVKVTCMFKAREVTHPELGQQRLAKFLEGCADLATSERTPTLDGRMMIMILNPKPQSGASKKKDAKNQDQQIGGQAVQDHGDGENNPPREPQQPPVPAQEGESEATAGAGAGSVSGGAEANAPTASSEASEG
jgi:translation initiation factor IF-3